jgi:hypothetical protein
LFALGGSIVDKLLFVAETEVEGNVRCRRGTTGGGGGDDDDPLWKGINETKQTSVNITLIKQVRLATRNLQVATSVVDLIEKCQQVFEHQNCYRVGIN